MYDYEASGRLLLSGFLIPDNLIGIFTIGQGTCNQGIVIGDNYSNITGFGFISSNEDGTTYMDSVGEMPTINEWYHITMTRTAEEIRFYLDGVLIKTISTIGAACTGEVPEADLGQLLGQYFEGRADDIRVYKRALTDDEVLGLTYGYDPATASFGLMSDFYYQANGKILFLGNLSTEFTYEAMGRLLLYDPRLFLWWKLDDGVGSSTAMDSSAYNHLGILVDMEPGSDWVAGNPDFTFINLSALNFDGMNEYVYTDLTDFGPLDGGFSLSVWINIDDVPAS